MDQMRKRLIASILAFLKGEFRSGRLDADNAEGMEVAIQCLENIYGCGEVPPSEPDLLEIYGSFFTPAILQILQMPDASEEDKRIAEQLKGEGNQAMNNGNYTLALDLYTRAISHDKKNAIYYCNRAAAHSRLQEHMSAIQDCKIAIEIDPRYSKAYGRLGLAYCGLEDYENALLYYRRAVELEPDNEGYKNNYELTFQKVNPSSKKSSVSSASGVFNPDPATSTSGIHVVEGIPPNIDLGSIFGNPQLVTMATQMLSNPSMQSVMRNLMTGVDDGVTRVDTLIDAGQRLATHIQTENPDLYNQLRQTIGIGEQDEEDEMTDQEPPPKNTGEKGTK